MFNKNFILFSLIINTLIFGCSKTENDCIKISNKKIINGLYLFYWDKDGFDVDSSNSNDLSGIQDKSRSGTVYKSDYESYKIGDKYCYADLENKSNFNEK